MPFTENRNQKIHFTVHGKGPTVVMQHGLLSHGRRFKDLGYVKHLPGYRVVLVDSLGHGKSDKPLEPSRYNGAERAADITAVLDALGAERTHYVGYSMGGWLGVQLAREAPERLQSVTIGGWDPIVGPSQGLALGAEGTRVLLEGARRAFPGLVDWITPDIEPCITACRAALEDNRGAADTLKLLENRLLLWAGREDECYLGVTRAARLLGVGVHENEGNHVGAVVRDVKATCAALHRHFVRNRL